MRRVECGSDHTVEKQVSLAFSNDFNLTVLFDNMWQLA